MKFFDTAAEVLIVVAIFGAVGFWFWNEDGQDVVDFGPAMQATAEDGTPGEWIAVSLPVRKLRPCQIVQDGGGLNGFFVGEVEPRALEWRRDGPLLKTDEHTLQIGAIQARIPIDAPPGPASLAFNPRFKCRIRTVAARSPAIAFTVLEN